MARVFIIIGVAFLLVGRLWAPLSKLGLDRLPGDFVIRRDGFTLYLPVASSILVSIILSLVIAVVRPLLGR